MKIYIDTILGPYSNEWVPAPRYLLRRARILSLLKKFKPGRVLEFGCGAGTLISELSPLGYDCTAIEESENALLLAQEFNKTTNNKLYKNLSNSNKINFEYLFAFEVLEHINDDLEALKTWRTYLSPTGKILLSVPAHQDKWNATDDWAGHVKRYEKEQLIELFNKAGFEVLYFESYGYPLANIIEPIRARHHKNELKKRTQQKENTISTNNHQSGISRNLESKLFFLLKNPLGKLIMQFFISLQSLFSKTDLGNGYIVIAQPK